METARDRQEARQLETARDTRRQKDRQEDRQVETHRDRQTHRDRETDRHDIPPSGIC